MFLVVSRILHEAAKQAQESVFESEGPRIALLIGSIL